MIVAKTNGETVNGQNSHSQNNHQNSHVNNVHYSTSEEYFNSDIICTHNQLCIQEIRRKLVSPEIWTKLKSYFPQTREFPYLTTKPCENCQKNDSQIRKAIENRKEMANSQRNALSDIFNERNRPSWAKVNKVYLVPRG